MRPSTHGAISHERLSSANTSDIKTATLPRGTSAVEFAIEGTSARVTFDGTDPSALNAPSLVYPAAQVPIFRPVGPGATIRFISTAGSPSVLQLLYYR